MTLLPRRLLSKIWWKSSSAIWIPRWSLPLKCMILITTATSQPKTYASWCPTCLSTETFKCKMCRICSRLKESISLAYFKRAQTDPQTKPEIRPKKACTRKRKERTLITGTELVTRRRLSSSRLTSLALLIMSRMSAWTSNLTRRSITTCLRRCFTRWWQYSMRSCHALLGSSDWGSSLRSCKVTLKRSQAQSGRLRPQGLSEDCRSQKFKLPKNQVVQTSASKM